MDQTAALRAFGQLVDACNTWGDPQRVAAACAPEVWIQRLGYHEERGQVVEELRGHQQVGDWLARTAKVVRFELEPGSLVPADQPSDWIARYVVVATDDFRGGGVWTARLDALGRIAWLQHQPDDLAGHWGGPARPHQH